MPTATPAATGPAAAAAYPSSSQHLKLALTSHTALELTVTEAAIESLTLAAGTATALAGIMQEPDTLLERMRASAAEGGACGTAFTLHNLTGSAMEVWLDVPLEDGSVPLRAPLGPPTLVAPSGADVTTLPVLPERLEAAGSRYAGAPSLALGVAIPTRARVPGEAGGAMYRTKRTLMYFRLTGHGPLTGPIQLDRYPHMTL